MYLEDSFTECVAFLERFYQGLGVGVNNNPVVFVVWGGKDVFKEFASSINCVCLTLKDCMVVGECVVLGDV